MNLVESGGRRINPRVVGFENPALTDESYPGSFSCNSFYSKSLQLSTVKSFDLKFEMGTSLKIP